MSTCGINRHCFLRPCGFVLSRWSNTGPMWLFRPAQNPFHSHNFYRPRRDDSFLAARLGDVDCYSNVFLARKNGLSDATLRARACASAAADAESRAFRTDTFPR